MKNRKQLVSRPLAQSIGQLMADMDLWWRQVAIYHNGHWITKSIRPHSVEELLARYEADRLWPLGDALVGGARPFGFERADHEFAWTSIGRRSGGGFFVGVTVSSWTGPELRSDISADIRTGDEPCRVYSSLGTEMSVGLFREQFGLPVAVQVTVPSLFERIRTFAT
ncbi:MAG TPA: hypothetical protein VMR98_02565 [Candidatus Polarisedimenticolaceae bacterium]|nr:hypothetical protein [Candidatus Polarisedimenticolaceae bacterium]